LSRSFQITNIFPRMSVYENLRCAVLWSQGYKYSFWHRVDALEAVRVRTSEIVDRIGMTKRRDRMAGVLTYAEQRALEIGVTIAGGANVILLDEPTAGIAQREVEALAPVVRRLRDDMGASLFVIDHDLPFLTEVSDRLVAMDRGQVIAGGASHDVLAHPAVVESYLGRTVAAVARSGATTPLNGDGS
jgi:branched-chain amino acid transport system ATP-binding protein